MPRRPEGRSMRKLFLETIGIGDGNIKFWSIWFMFSITLGLVANLTVLISCMSPSTQSIYLFRVSSEDLIHATTNVTKASADDLRIKELPHHWYWGLSGVCVIYGDDEVSCEKKFPPTMTIKDMLSFAVEAQLPETTGNTTAAVEKTIKPWTSALASLEDSLPNPSGVNTKLKAATALALVATILAALSLPLTLLSLTILRTKLPRWTLYILALISAGFFLGAGILLIYAMNDGPRSILEYSGIDQGNERTYIGPGFFVLFAGVLFTLISIGIFFCVAFCVVLMIVFALLACCSGACSSGRRKEEVVVYVDHHYPQYQYEK
ncbi:Fc.00g022830.m01.CDS01 [Cosmosporella sp. VM-42]